MAVAPKLTPTQEAMIWMNQKFGPDIEQALKNTPIPKKLVIAIGMQETYYVWAKLYKRSTPEQVLAFCVGDTIDFPRRKKAWPKNRAELQKHPKGKEMFKVAREALELVATISPSYAKVAKNKDKFCHGFGMFQYDIQFFKEADPDFFLNRSWATWKGTLGRGVDELKGKLVGLYGEGKKSLTYDETVFLGIAYNKGAKGTVISNKKDKFKQGYEDDGGVYYGEHIDAFLKAQEKLY